MPKYTQTGLMKVGVEILDIYNAVLRCTQCGNLWIPML
jgi:hypothetical protein